MNPPVSTQRVLFDVARLAGYIPAGEDANFDQAKAQEVLSHIDDRLNEAWDMFDFLETTVIEKRVFRPDFDPDVCYPLGAIVWDPCTEMYYQALAQTVGGPLINPSVWLPNPTVTPRYIPWWEPGRTPIGAAFGAWNLNPHENSNRRRVDYLLSQRGLEFTATTDLGAVWLLFRIPYPGIGKDEWSATITYSLGDAVVDGTDSYISSIDNNTAAQPSVSPDKWAIFRVPYSMKRYVTQAAFADTLVTSGQNEKAPGELQKAFGYLQEAFDQQTIQQGQMQQWRGYSGR